MSTTPSERWTPGSPGRGGDVLDIMRNGIDSALLGLGHSSVHDLTPADVIAPTAFLRGLGTEPPA